MSDRLDRHIRRSGSDYTEAFLALLPSGQAWPRSLSSTLYKACRGFCEYWGFVDSRIADLLEQESDPRITIELLPDWERAWGLPDPCYTAPQSIGERQDELLRRMTMLGAQSRQFFIDLAADFGSGQGYTITITEFRTFVVGMDRCGDNRVKGDGSTPAYWHLPLAPYTIGYNDYWNRPVLNDRGVPVVNAEESEWPYYGLGPDTNRFYWTVHVDAGSLTWFRCSESECGVDPHLRVGTAEDLECLLNRWKPGHTYLIFDYSGLSGGGPMAGTP